MLSASTEQQLNQKLDAFARSSGSQILIMTFPSLEGEVVEDYTIRVAEQWEVKGDRALIVFVFEAERLVRLEVGYGLEGAIPDAFADQIIRNVITPRFREGNFDAGITNAIQAITARISGEESPIAFDGPSGTGVSAPGGCLSLLIPVMIILIFLFVLGPLVRRTGMRGCGCLPIPFIFPGGTTFGGGRGGFGGGGFGGGGGIGGSWGGGGFGSFGGGGATGGW